MMVEAYTLKYLHLIKLKRYSLLVFFFILHFFTYSQGSEVEKLKTLRKKYQSEIINAQKLLEKKGVSKANNLNELKVLNSKINSQQSIISTYQSEIEVITKDIEKNKTFINDLALEIKSLKKGYATLIMEANKQLSSNLNELMIIFSANTFSEAYRRFSLLKQYSSYRKKQGVVLEITKAKHDSIQVRNINSLQEKKKVYNLLNSEFESLKLTISKKENYIAQLQKDESWLKREIKKKQKAASELEKTIEKLIKESLATPSKYMFSNFSKAKGQLIWPVKDGIVTSRFGEHNHAVLKGVKVKNNGIDITALKENAVKCIYEGTVSRVIAIPGYNKAVIIRHGKYLTVYANLVNVYVKSGETIHSNQEIGQIYTDSDDKSGILHFEIWEENKKINPTDWLTNFN